MFFKGKPLFKNNFVFFTGFFKVPICDFCDLRFRMHLQRVKRGKVPRFTRIQCTRNLKSQKSQIDTAFSNFRITDPNPNAKLCVKFHKTCKTP